MKFLGNPQPSRKAAKVPLLIIALVAVIGFTFAACGDDDNGGGTQPKTVKYESTDAAGYKFILTVTENTARAAYIAVAGDTYVLTIKKAGEPDKVSKGTVTSVGVDGTLTLQPSNQSSATFSVSITAGGQISAITGAVTLEDGTTVTAGDFDSGGGNNDNVFTSIADMAAWLAAQPANTAATAYAVKLNVSSLGGSSNTAGSAGAALKDNDTKYLSLDLSGSSFTSIENSAFPQCTSLTSVTIGNSVTSIGNGVFGGCTNLANITIPDSVASISYELCWGTAWYDNQPDGLVYAGKVALLYKGSMPANTSITFLDGTKGIADEAFNVSNLTSITIPASVTNIGNKAFGYYCTNLTSVTFNGTITEANFNSMAFYGGGSGGDLRAKYLANGIGTYTTTAPVSSSSVWTKQGGGGNNDNVFTDAEDMKTWLAAQPANTIDTPYTVKLNVAELETLMMQGDSVGGNLIGNYVNIDLSGSTFTSFNYWSSIFIVGVTLPATLTRTCISGNFEVENISSITFLSTIAEEDFLLNEQMWGNLRAAYLAGGPGTYTGTTPPWAKVWTK